MVFPSFLLSFFLVSHLLVLHSSVSSCPSSFDCGTHGRFKFPFTNNKTDPDCGLSPLSCDEPALKVRLGAEGKFIQVSGIHEDAINISDPILKDLIGSRSCDFFSYFHPLDFGPVSYTISPSRTFFKCPPSNPDHEDLSAKYLPDNYMNYTGEGCRESTVFYPHWNNTAPTPGSMPGCLVYQLPVVSSVEDQNPSDPFSVLTSNFTVDFHESKEKGTGISVELGEEGKSIRVSGIHDDAINISDQTLKSLIEKKSCDFFSYFHPPDNDHIPYTISPSRTSIKCNTSGPDHDDDYIRYWGEGCYGSTAFYLYRKNTVLNPGSVPENCVRFQLPGRSSVEDKSPIEPFSLLTSDFSVEYHFLFPSPSPPISPSSNVPKERDTDISVSKERGRSHLGLILGIVIPGVILFACLLIIWYHKKWRNTSSDRFSKQDLEEGSVFFGIPVFSFSELKEATHNFDPFKELGDGGFGTVYHGKLQDGREVAVKRLYQHNYKRVAQFLNEIEILMHLRHPNLVTLYGCTSRHSRELLLVYEYIPNGTVADHLHGDRAKDHPLPWPIRMNIAIETASALVYLHASDIIHRDVKTNNILLDNNFCVKVADFGLSRLFPTDVSHVSTAPQGTPGYVDPDYHQCYQLTDKSDVYSFGVVLMELISSLPAVDISRHRHEINLANLAISKIQEGGFNELIDPALGFNSDSLVERMTTSVAEVAFRCLQLKKEMRPRMNEVLEALKEIQEYKDDEIGEMPPPSPDGDNAELLNSSKVPPSQDSVTE